MSVIVNTNVQSLVSQRNLSSATSALNKSTTRLSTGKKINSAVDDAAGLFVAKGLESQLNGSQQCQTNIALGVNVLQIAEGDMVNIQDNVQRIKDLCTQAASGIYSDQARTAMQDEIDARVAEINRIAASSNFNGINLLGGTFNTSGLTIQVGAGSTTNDAITIGKNDGTFAAVTATGLFMSTGCHDGANGSIDVSSVANATNGIKDCEAALTNLTTRRSKIGVGQARLESASAGLATTIENLSAAKSTIMDTDVASETSNYTKQQILQQISSSVLTQANQAPSIALSLMG